MRTKSTTLIGRRDGGEVGRTDGHLRAVDRLVEEGKDGAEQHDDGEADEEHVVGDEEPLAREGVIDTHRRAQPVTAPGEQARTERHDHEEEADEQRTQRARGEGVHALQHARAGEERGEDR